jgi:hypothetical protein
VQEDIRGPIADKITLDIYKDLFGGEIKYEYLP